MRGGPFGRTHWIRAPAVAPRSKVGYCISTYSFAFTHFPLVSTFPRGFRDRQGPVAFPTYPQGSPRFTGFPTFFTRASRYSAVFNYFPPFSGVFAFPRISTVFRVFDGFHGSPRFPEFSGFPRFPRFLCVPYGASRPPRISTRFRVFPRFPFIIAFSEVPHASPRLFRVSPGFPGVRHGFHVFRLFPAFSSFSAFSDSFRSFPR